MVSALTFGTKTSILVGLLVAAIAYTGSYFVGDYNTDWYRSLNRPATLPPELERNIPYIWAGLYVLAGVGLAAVLWVDRGTIWKLSALTLLIVVQGLNYGYTHIFTIEQDLNRALLIAAGLTATVAVFLLLTAAARVWLAVVCYLPYLGWCAYATLLTSQLAALNPAAG